MRPTTLGQRDTVANHQGSDTIADPFAEVEEAFTFNFSSLLLSMAESATHQTLARTDLTHHRSLEVDVGKWLKLSEIVKVGSGSG